MKRILILKPGDPNEIAKDLNKLFGFKVCKVEACDILDREIIGGMSVTYKASKRKYEKFLETRERYGF